MVCSPFSSAIISVSYLIASHVQVCDEPLQSKVPLLQTCPFIRSQSFVVDLRQLHVFVLGSQEKPVGSTGRTGVVIVPPNCPLMMPRSCTSPDAGGDCSGEA